MKFGLRTKPFNITNYTHKRIFRRILEEKLRMVKSENHYVIRAKLITLTTPSSGYQIN